MPDLTTSQLSARMKELDSQIVGCLAEFITDTGILVSDAFLNWDDEHGYVLHYCLVYPDSEEK
jgi:hypothetical protein